MRREPAQARDDMDEEQLRRHPDARKNIIAGAFAPLVLADTLKAAALMKDKSIADAWKESTLDYPHSVFDKALETKDVLKSHFPKLAAEYPGTTDKLGLLGDVMDPISYGITKFAKLGKVPVTLAQVMMASADKGADKAAANYVKKNIAAHAVDKVPALIDYIKQNKLRGKLARPQDALERLQGKYEYRQVGGTADHPIKEMRKLSKGTMDEVGESLSDVIARAQEGGAPNINREEILDNMVADKALVRSSTSKTGGKKLSLESYSSDIDDILKATTEHEGLPSTPVITGPQDLWELKKSIGQKMTDKEWAKEFDLLPSSKQNHQDVYNRANDAIKYSISHVDLPEGNAKDIYMSKNQDFGNQAELENILLGKRLKSWREEGGKGALPSLGAALGIGIGSKIVGGSIPTAAMAGMVGGGLARQGLLSRTPEIGAAVLDRFSTAKYAHPTTQGLVELAEIPSKYEREGSDREVESPASSGSATHSPEAKKLLEQHSGRVPQSIESAPPMAEEPHPMDEPVRQKMDETLMPQKQEFTPYVNDQILNTILPRDTDRLLANPDALLAKLQQVAPNQVPVLKDILQHDPDQFRDVVPKLAGMFPALFERDKYNMFDGKIVDPQMQQKFLTDLSEDDGLDSIQKASLALKVRRGTSIYK